MCLYKYFYSSSYKLLFEFCIGIYVLFCDSVKNNCSFIGSGTQLVISQDNFVIDGSDPSIAGSFSVLDADGLSRVLYITGHDVTLRNIVLINGYYSSSSDLSSVGAGAVFISYGAFVDHCVFLNNFVSGVKEAHGAGLSFVETDDVGVQNSEFINDTVYALNSYSGGAGLFSTSDNTVIYNCSFVNNRCENINDSIHSHGGAFCVNSPLVTVGDCVFLNNSAVQGGATTLHTNCSLDICSFVDNVATGLYGGAISTGWESTTNINVNITNSYFDSNLAYYSGALH